MIACLRGRRAVHLCTPPNATGVTVVAVRGYLVAVETDVGGGLPSLMPTGLSGPASRTTAPIK